MKNIAIPKIDETPLVLRAFLTFAGSSKHKSWYRADECHLNGITQMLQNTIEIQAFCYLHDSMLAHFWCFRVGLPYHNFGHFMPYYKLGHAGNGYIS